MKRLNRTRPSANPWGTPLVNGLQLDFMLLITSLNLAVQFTFLSLSLSTYPVISFSMKILVKNLSQVKVQKVDCSPRIHQTTHHIVENYQVTQVQFTVHKSMLTSFNCLLFLSIFWIFFQCCLFYHFPGCWGDAGQPLAPGILLLGFLEDKKCACFLPVLRNLSQLPSSLKDNWEWPQWVGSKKLSLASLLMCCVCSCLPWT